LNVLVCPERDKATATIRHIRLLMEKKSAYSNTDDGGTLLTVTAIQTMAVNC